ncbi:MAG: hypothetical protein D6732_28550 [Methanobacteriota archaeon]|nr:MAG: hypothetical protein D6732_28550 [Euryarchaeota archaeon]
MVRDALVMRDAFGFPCIPGTSIAGVVRHALEDHAKEEEREALREFFGYQESNTGVGAKIRFSPALLVIKNDVPSLHNFMQYAKEFKWWFTQLPVRNHVRINHRGVVDGDGLFDNEIVYKGGRFVAEFELTGSEDDLPLWNKVLEVIRSSIFRVGQGTRKGYGRLQVIGLSEKKFDLREQQDFQDYLEYDSNFCPAWRDVGSLLLLAESHESQPEERNEPESEGVIHYELRLYPESFFFFGSGHGDEDADDTPLLERVITYDENNYIHLADARNVIPGSSIKGALRHRTCFYYNKRKKRYAEVYANSQLVKIVTGNMNNAVYALFGAESGASFTAHDGILENGGPEARSGRRGVVLIDDVFLENVVNDKVLNHIQIDRFTGGVIDGALFSEKVSRFKDDSYVRVSVKVLPFEVKDQEDIIGAFEDALRDVCRGVLPLGGMATKGQGIFTGSLWKNGEKMYEYLNPIK